MAFLADGMSVHTRRWLSCFEGKFDVHLITSRANPIEGVTIHELGFSLARDSWFHAHAGFPLRVLKIRRMVKEVAPDVLHAHYITNYGVCAALSGFHPFLLSAWGDDLTVDPERSRVKSYAVRFALGRADLVHTGSGLSQLRMLGCDRKKILVQQWGVDLCKFRPEARSERLRSSLGVDGGFMVLCARYWELPYDVEVLVRAVPLVLEKMPDVKFVLLGGGSLEPSLKSLAGKLGVSENVVFVGKVSEDVMPAYLASADVYVDPPSMVRPDGTVERGTSGIGQTMRQAMACGVAQILSLHPSTLYTEWFSGLAYRGRDHVDLAAKIVHLLKDDEERLGMGWDSRRAALRVLDEKVFVEKWVGIYEGFGRVK